MQRKKEGRVIKELQNARKVAPAQNRSNEERAVLRKPGAWANLPKPARKVGAWAKLPKAAQDWDAPEANAAISEALSDGKLR
jgi:hypothetical protein